MNTRRRMYLSNTEARKLILSWGATDVYFQRHTKRKNKHYTKDYYYLATDFFNLFDGMCFLNGALCFFQVKTNAWPSTKPIQEFLRNKYGFRVFAVNVVTKPKHEVRVRWYEKDDQR